MKKKIAVLSEICSVHSGSRAPIEIAKQLGQNFQVTFYAYNTYQDREVLKELKNHQIKVELFSPPKIPLGKFLLVLQLTKKLRREKYSLVSFHGTLPFFLAAKISGIPIVRTYYGTQWDAFLEKFSPDKKPSVLIKIVNRFLNQLIIILEKFFLRNSDYAVAISHYTAREARRIGRKKVVTIYLGADHLLTSKSPPSPRYAGLRGTRKKTKKPFLLSVSRFTPYKGFHLLVKALKQISPQFDQLQLYLVGSTPNLNYLKYLKFLKKTLPVKIITDISDQKLAQLYQQSLFYVTADRFLFFGFPVLEAAFFKKPTVAFDSAAASEIIKNGQTGFTVKNKKEFISYCSKLIPQFKRRQKMGRNAYLRAKQNFTWKKCGQSYINFFNKTLKEK